MFFSAKSQIPKEVKAPAANKGSKDDDLHSSPCNGPTGVGDNDITGSKGPQW